MALPLLASGPAVAATLPAGFDETSVVSLQGLHQFAWAPDGDLFIATKNGDVRRFSGGSLTSVLNITVSNVSERGLNGMVADPDYLTNKHVWIYYTAPDETNQVWRYTFNGTTLGSGVPMLVGPLTSSPGHVAGCLRFGVDGTLFIAMGDDHQGSITAQDPFDMRGKILHMNRDGSPAADNPYLDGSAGNPYVWALGFRNPYRFSIQPGSGNVFIGDVGNAAWEEISLGIPGGNYGWAEVEGPNPQGEAGFVYPLYEYNHNQQGAAVIAGDFADVGDFSPQYEGDYFFGDFSKGEIYRMELDGSNNPVSVEVFASDVFQLVDLVFGPDSSLYYVERGVGSFPGQLKKVSYVGGDNSQPVAVALATPDSGAAPLLVQLDGTASFDPDEDPLGYLWDMGDLGTSTQSSLVRSFELGVHHVELTVDDGAGGEDLEQVRIVSGNTAPLASVSTPADESLYVGGQTISYSGQGLDLEDGVLPCSALTWQVLFHHGAHSYPYVGPIQGNCGGTFDIEVYTEPSTNVYYEVRLSAADSGSPLGSEAVLTDMISIEIRPTLADITLETLPEPDFELELDGLSVTAPITVASVVGTVRVLGGGEPQARPDGHTYRWLGWSDAGAQQHEIVTQPLPTTYSATFGCDLQVEVDGFDMLRGANGAVDMSWLPVTAPCFAEGPQKYRVYAAETPRPLLSSGEFPINPEWTVVGTTTSESFSFVPGPNEKFFVVVGVGSDGLDGVVGHYGE
ncbi:MAG: hypothetical protein GY716_05795 [bacterium]|nr:hypothetical protein [bacterium]